MIAVTTSSDYHESELIIQVLDIFRMDYLQLSVTGCVLGVLHVVLGPDHLSALATLSVGNSWKAVTLGIRWGLGHSTGLVVVAVTFILLKGQLDLKRLAKVCNLMLGVFMTIIGLSGIFSAIKTSIGKRKKEMRGDYPESASGKTVMKQLVHQDSIVNEKLVSSSSVTQTSSHHHKLLHSSTSSSDLKMLSSFDGDQYHHHDHIDDIDCGCKFMNTSQSSMIDMKDPFTQRIVSFAIGILHGAAGPGMASYICI